MAIVISEPYLMLKKRTFPEYAGEVLIENRKRNDWNVERTAREMRCSKNTIYFSLAKQNENNLSDRSHTPRKPHPRKTREETIRLVIKRREETGFGKRRLRLYLYTRDGLLIPESTIGKILEDNGLTQSKKRVRREWKRIKYSWDKIVPSEESEMDTKEIA